MKFLPCNPDQAYLLPSSVKDVLGENHLCFFVQRAVECILAHCRLQTEVAQSKRHLPGRNFTLLTPATERQGSHLDVTCITD